jgi:16S rRNA (guanine966-N2)-methyltransferase
VRVISGVARGRTLRAALQTRPTADLIKGAIFSMLEALAYKRGFEPDEDGNLAAALAWPRTLDLFAGSGGLGIEALSRGAQSAEFIERDRDAARIIQANLRATGLDDRARVHQAAATAALRTVRGPVDLVFLDPPYDDTEALDAAWASLGAGDLLLPTSVVVLEQSAKAEPPEGIGSLTLSTTRRHGRTRVSLYSAEHQPVTDPDG